jgi:tetratricopeptide (TPR) repeat protein
MELAWPARWKKVLESRWSAAAVLVVITVAAYWPALHAGFTWNDDEYVVKNQTLRDLSGLRDIWFKIGPLPPYYPLVQTTFWLEYHVWGLNPFGYHLTNVSLHAVAAVLVWRVLRWLKAPGAWLAAALFALHPVHVESVAWIAQRKNVLSAVFYCAAALTYLRFRQLKDAGVSLRRSWYFYSWALLFFVVALLSERVSASLPAALLLIRWWKKGRLRGSDFLPLAPFFLLGAVSVLVTTWLEKHQVRLEAMVRYLAFPQHFLLAGRALWFYAAKLLWPSRLTFIYPYLDLNVKQWWQWFFPIVAVAVIATLWCARRRIGRPPVVALLFFAGTLFPALGFLNVHPFGYSYVADHFQYLASIGLIVLAAAGLSRLPRVTGLGLLGILGVLTWQQAQLYRDPQTLWRDTVKKNPGSWVSRNNLGNALVKLGKVDEAIPEYRWAIKRHPELRWSYDNLGRAYLQASRVNDAIVCFQKACEIKPSDPLTCQYLSNALLNGKADEGILSFQKALETKPDYAEAEYNLAVTLDQKGNTDQAVAHYRKALQLKPNFEEPKWQLRKLGVQIPN